MPFRGAEPKGGCTSDPRLRDRDDRSARDIETRRVRWLTAGVSVVGAVGGMSSFLHRLWYGTAWQRPNPGPYKCGDLPSTGGLPAMAAANQACQRDRYAVVDVVSWQ